MNESLANAIKQQAQCLGFDLCGIASVHPSAFKAEFRDWLERGYAGEMAYMARDPERRLDPGQLLKDAKSIVVVAMNYYTESEADTNDPQRAIFARYARNKDYHDIMATRLQQLLAFIQERAGPGVKGKVYVDTGPLLEREVAQRAGLGWFGKNSMLINTRRGSYFLLGELLLNIALPPDRPAVGGCGTCTRCLEACPTKAIVQPYVVDSRRCISYLTIELKGPIPEEFAEKIGNRIFGCDICQEVCPFNIRHAKPTPEPAFQPREATCAPRLTDLLRMDEEKFREAFRHSPVKRAKRRGLLRNVAAGLSSCADLEAERALEAACKDAEPLVREQAERSLRAIRLRLRAEIAS
jgi:epoxyqueuosine reductase